MEFKETDTEAEHELKLRVLRIYNRRLLFLFELFVEFVGGKSFFHLKYWSIQPYLHFKIS